MANVVKSEEKILYQAKNMNPNSAVSTNKKKESKPKFIHGDLERYYEKTDLELAYVFDCCKTLKPLKGIDVNNQQVEFWYKEFIRMGWKKKHFDKQFEVVKRANLFGRIDFASWLQTEIMYNEIDLLNRLDEIIEGKIQRGKFLKDKEAELSEEDKKAIDLAVAKEIELGYQNGWYEKRDSYQEERKKKILGL